jgi:hypothetical protein
MPDILEARLPEKSEESNRLYTELTSASTELNTFLRKAANKDGVMADLSRSVRVHVDTRWLDQGLSVSSTLDQLLEFYQKHEGTSVIYLPGIGGGNLIPASERFSTKDGISIGSRAEKSEWSSGKVIAQNKQSAADSGTLDHLADTADVVFYLQPPLTGEPIERRLESDPTNLLSEIGISYLLLENPYLADETGTMVVAKFKPVDYLSSIESTSSAVKNLLNTEFSPDVDGFSFGGFELARSAVNRFAQINHSLLDAVNKGNLSNAELERLLTQENVFLEVQKIFELSGDSNGIKALEEAMAFKNRQVIIAHSPYDSADLAYPFNASVKELEDPQTVADIKLATNLAINAGSKTDDIKEINWLLHDLIPRRAHILWQRLMAMGRASYSDPINNLNKNTPTFLLTQKVMKESLGERGMFVVLNDNAGGVVEPQTEARVYYSLAQAYGIEKVLGLQAEKMPYKSDSGDIKIPYIAHNFIKLPGIRELARFWVSCYRQGLVVYSKDVQEVLAALMPFQPGEITEADPDTGIGRRERMTLDSTKLSYIERKMGVKDYSDMSDLQRMDNELIMYMFNSGMVARPINMEFSKN